MEIGFGPEGLIVYEGNALCYVTNAGLGFVVRAVEECGEN